MVWYGICMVWYGMVWYGVVWCGVVWCGVVWCGVVWCGVVVVVVVVVVWCGVVWLDQLISTGRPVNVLVRESIHPYIQLKDRVGLVMWGMPIGHLSSV